jgi:hypothetical protein
VLSGFLSGPPTTVRELRLLHAQLIPQPINREAVAARRYVELGRVTGDPR